MDFKTSDMAIHHVDSELDIKRATFLKALIYRTRKRKEVNIYIFTNAKIKEPKHRYAAVC